MISASTQKAKLKKVGRQDAENFNKKKRHLWMKNLPQ
jgi:hypothetical protein